MGKIEKLEISTAMKQKYLDYALSVIVGRALPDVRDGMKWVHRRIIFEMGEMGLTNDKGYKKSARIVGNVLGKFHPHGDGSVYDAMVRLAQDFSTREPLIDGHGNWGSVDGDSAAAYRYTEAKMRKIAVEMLRDINKNTVDFIPNFDGEEQEPSVLPSRFPNLLVNGSEGIAVGFATAMPPHNLKEAIDCILYQINNPDCNIEELVKILKAPDFPTCGQIINPQNMVNVYKNGFGSIKMRAKHHLEIEDKVTKIIFTEIPYQLNKAKLLDDIHSLTIDKIVEKQDKKVVIKAIIPQITDVMDESDRNGMRISLTLKKNSNVDMVLALLFSNTKLQCNYNANFTAIYKDNLLEHISLKELNKYYIDHQKDVLIRRTKFDLEKSKQRLLVLEGLIKALNNIDKTIELIKTSSSKNVAKNKLMEYLIIDEKQTEYILSLQLQRLTGLEIESIKNEYKELLKTIGDLNKILNNEDELLKILKKELEEIKKRYGNERRTEIIYNNEESNIIEISESDLIEDYTTTIIFSREQYIKKTRKYSENQKVKQGDEVLNIQQCSNRGKVILLSNKGNAYLINISDLEDKLPSQLGVFLPSLLDLQKDETILNMLVTNDYTGHCVAVFENGKIAKIPLTSYQTKNNRKMLANSLSLENNAVSIYQINGDIDIELHDSFGKTKTINTSNINEKSKRDTIGVQAHKSTRNGFKIVSSVIIQSNS